MRKIKICVGSLNPTKINAVEIGFGKYFKKIEVFKIKVNSKVSNQPIGMEKILKGAINRAKAALDYLLNEINEKSDIFGIGIEAGLVPVPHTRTGYMDFQFCAIIDENQKISLGSGIAFEYPQFVIDQILENNDLEIGQIMGKLAGNMNLKNELGAISFLSKNRIKRTEILTQAVICALLPWINKKIYKESN
ncbi:MAG: inosine/xanthosine triphosphatase [Candidatus Lokiarchaeota archaeon]|nr:inosine/xanthosine triphosphatase [Candidatus Lokiarchaeota archaeon]